MRPESPVLPPGPPPSDPFPYGWRCVKRARPDGTIDFDQVPLTLEDVLHPQEEDVIPQRPAHTKDCMYLAEVFEARRLAPPVVAVTCDLLIDWGVPGLRPHSPDVAVFVGLREAPAPNRGTLRLKELAGRCLLVVEVVSPDTRANDATVKVDHYHRAGVPLYVLIDQEREDASRHLLAYRWKPGGYEPVALDGSGRLHLPELALHLSVRGGRAVCHDALTGRELGDYSRVTRELEEADRRNEEQEQALEEAIGKSRELADERDRALKEARALTEARDRALEEQRKAEAAALDLAKRVEEAEKRLRALEDRAANPPAPPPPPDAPSSSH